MMKNAFLLLILLSAFTVLADELRMAEFATQPWLAANHEKIPQLSKIRLERDKILTQANAATAGGNRQQGDQLFSQVQELNKQAQSLRLEVVNADLKVKKNYFSKKIGGLANYQYEFFDPFMLVVVAHDPEFKKLYRYLPFINKVLFSSMGCRNKAPQATFVFVAANRTDYLKLGKMLLGHEPQNPFGFYNPKEGYMLIDIAGGPGPLLREASRVMVCADNPSFPAWFIAGISLLNESSQFIVDRKTKQFKVKYLANQRLKLQQGKFSASKQIPLSQALIALPKDLYRYPDQELLKAQLRHFMLWLVKRGKLQDVYSVYRDGQHGKVSAAQVLETVFAKKFSDIETEYNAWLQRQFKAIPEK